MSGKLHRHPARYDRRVHIDGLSCAHCSGTREWDCGSVISSPMTMLHRMPGALGQQLFPPSEALLSSTLEGAWWIPKHSRPRTALACLPRSHVAGIVAENRPLPRRSGLPASNPPIPTSHSRGANFATPRRLTPWSRESWTQHTETCFPHRFPFPAVPTTSIHHARCQTSVLPSIGAVAGNMLDTTS